MSERAEARRRLKREKKLKQMTPPEMSAAQFRSIYANAALICKQWNTGAVALETLKMLTDSIKLDINAFANASETEIEYAESHNNLVVLTYLNWEDAANKKGSTFVPLELIKNNVEDIADGFINGSVVNQDAKEVKKKL